MLRGKHKLNHLTTSTIGQDQSSLFPEEKTTLYEEKVKLLIARYCFYINEKPNPDSAIILLKLEKEFFISTGRIADILMERSEEVKKLRQEKPKAAWYKATWAHIVW